MSSLFPVFSRPQAGWSLLFAIYSDVERGRAKRSEVRAVLVWSLDNKRMQAGFPGMELEVRGV